MIQKDFVRAKPGENTGPALVAHRLAHELYGQMSDTELLRILELYGTHRYMSVFDTAFQKFHYDYYRLNKYLVARSILANPEQKPGIVLVVDCATAADIHDVTVMYGLEALPAYPENHQSAKTLLDLSELSQDKIDEVFELFAEGAHRNIVMLRAFSPFVFAHPSVMV